MSNHYDLFDEAEIQSIRPQQDNAVRDQTVAGREESQA